MRSVRPWATGRGLAKPQGTPQPTAHQISGASPAPPRANTDVNAHVMPCPTAPPPPAGAQQVQSTQAPPIPSGAE